MVLHYVDGGRGDDDLVTNGTIANLGAPAVTLNQAPTIEAQGFEILENATAVGTVIADDADLPDESLSFEISGGADADQFSSDADGQLSFNAAPDFENPADNDGDNTYEIEVQVTDASGASDTATVSVVVNNQTAVISGQVFIDVDADGAFDVGSDSAMDGVAIDLIMGNEVLASDVTELGGVFAFEVGDEMATYHLLQHQPSGVADGIAVLGDAGGTVISSNEMQVTLTGQDASDYMFTETGQGIQQGDTAPIGFWLSRRGRSLIKQGGQELVNWLNDNFSNIFGDSFSTAEEVATFYRREFFIKKFRGQSLRELFRSSPKADAQFMATALSTFFTNQTLAGNAATSYGFNVTGTGLGSKLVNVGDSGEAFGVQDGTSMTVMSLLLATKTLTGVDDDDDDNDYSYIYDTNGDGMLDETEKGLRDLANQIYRRINHSGS